MKNKDARIRLLTVIGVIVYLIVAWSCIISLAISLWERIHAVVIDERVAFVLGFIAGLLCSLYSIHRQDIADFFDGKMK